MVLNVGRLRPFADAAAHLAIAARHGAEFQRAVIAQTPDDVAILAAVNGGGGHGYGAGSFSFARLGGDGCRAAHVGSGYNAVLHGGNLIIGGAPRDLRARRALGRERSRQRCGFILAQCDFGLIQRDAGYRIADGNLTYRRHDGRCAHAALGSDGVGAALGKRDRCFAVFIGHSAFDRGERAVFPGAQLYAGNRGNFGGAAVPDIILIAGQRKRKRLARQNGQAGLIEFSINIAVAAGILQYRYIQAIALGNRRACRANALGERSAVLIEIEASAVFYAPYLGDEQAVAAFGCGIAARAVRRMRRLQGFIVGQYAVRIDIGHGHFAAHQL